MSERSACLAGNTIRHHYLQSSAGRTPSGETTSHRGWTPRVTQEASPATLTSTAYRRHSSLTETSPDTLATKHIGALDPLRKMIQQHWQSTSVLRFSQETNRCSDLSGDKSSNTDRAHRWCDLSGGKTSNTGMLSTSMLRSLWRQVQQHWHVEHIGAQVLSLRETRPETLASGER